MTDSSTQTEQVIRAAFEAGDVEAATDATLRAYSQEIRSFLRSRLRDEGDAEEAFSMFAEQLWASMPKFTWRCSMRTWSYALARNVASSYAAAPQRRAARNMPLSSPGIVSNLMERVRSVTHRFRQTEVKDRFRALREQLDVEDQMLLVLRVDRGMAWRDLAIAMGGDADLDEAAIERESARLRKAFERVKRELRSMAEREGLLAPKT